MEVVISIVVPVLVTGMFNVFLFRLQMKKEEETDKADIITKLDATIMNLLDQNTELHGLLAQERIQRRHIRDGALSLVKQVERLKDEPVYRPNGK